jgi:hypothetical protein
MPNFILHIILLSYRQIHSQQDVKQTLLQEIDMAMIDSSRWKSLRRKINGAIKNLQISGIPFMRDMIRLGKFRNNLTFDMTNYPTDHNLSYDHKSACKKRTHLRCISSIDI